MRTEREVIKITKERKKRWIERELRKSYRKDKVTRKKGERMGKREKGMEEGNGVEGNKVRKKTVRKKSKVEVKE